MKKKLLIVVGILVAIPVLLLTAAVLLIDPIVRRGVEREGSAALKVPVRLDSASVRWRGEVALGRFEIANPQGFGEPRALVWERVVATARPRELFQEVIHVGDVTIVKPQLTLEFAGTRNNLSALMDNLSAGRSRGETKSEGKKFLIRRIRIEDATVRFRSDLLGGNDRSFALPTLELDNVGTAEGGATLAEILEKVLQTLGQAALAAGGGTLPAKLLENLRGAIRELPGRSLDEIRRRAEEQLKSKELDPADLERRLRERLKPKTAD